MANADTVPIEFAVQSTVQAGEIAALATEAERLGFARFLVPDHPGMSNDPFVALTAAALATATIGLGTYVLNAGIREPWQVATAAATLDELCGGRLLLGLGAGHTPSEWRFLGLKRPDAYHRVQRLEEFVEIVRALLVGEQVTFHGEHFRLDGAQLDGQALTGRRVPLIIGGNGRRLLRLAGRSAQIVSVTGLGRTLQDGHTHEPRWSPGQVEGRMREIAHGASGRHDGPKIEILVQHLEVTDDRGAAADRFRADVPELDRESALDTPFVLFGTPREIAAQLRGWRERLGITSWVFRREAMPAAAAVADLL